MRLWLDDVRPEPDGWERARNAQEAIAALATGNVTHASLDHDLGEDATGYDVLLWVEKQMAGRTWYGSLPVFTVHSANPVGRARMLSAILAIRFHHAAMLDEGAA